MERPIFILLHTVQGKIFADSRPVTDIEVERGSLLIELNQTARDRVAFAQLFNRNFESNLIFFEIFGIRNVYLICTAYEVESICSKYAKLLLALDDLEKRYELFKMQDFLLSATHLQVDDEVDVALPNNKTALGIIRFIGQVYPIKSATYFGVQLKNCRGYSDGTFENKRFFNAPPDSSIFVSVDCLKFKKNVRIVPIVREAEIRSKPMKPDVNSNIIELNNCRQFGQKPSLQRQDFADNKPLTVDERVIWPKDNSIERGVVRWVGHLPTHPDWIAGVEFDNPVGNGTGNYGGKQLFSTELDHAALVPVGGLIKTKDFDFDQPAIEYQHQSTMLTEASTSDSFQIDSCIELDFDGEIKFGVIRWIGNISGKSLVGLELDDDLPLSCRDATNGTYRGVQYFSCAPSRGLFVPISVVRSDSRLYMSPPHSAKDFGSTDSGTVKAYIGPVTLSSLHNLCGRPRGIQGHKNSCYLDATLFAMFVGIDAFDSMVLRPKQSDDIKNYIAIQDLLKFEIIFPLRRFHYVRADHICRLRRLLSESLVDVSGLTEEEKDPEELLNGLFGVIFKAQPDISLTSGQTSHLCQLIIGEWGRPSKVATLQMLLERSFFHSNISLKKIPTRLIVQVPRYGKEKLYKWIVPNLRLELSYILENNPKKCWSCNSTATLQCQECFLVDADSLAQTFFCPACFEKFHASLSKENNDHASKPIEKIADGAHNHSKVYLDLVSVLCIESSHYVAFSRVGQGADASWVFFDSMADRKGFGDGYNVPEVNVCDNLVNWMSDDNFRRLISKLDSDKNSDDSLPPYLNRLLKDCYICFYVWNDGLLYS